MDSLKKVSNKEVQQPVKMHATGGYIHILLTGFFHWYIFNICDCLENRAPILVYIRLSVMPYIQGVGFRYQMAFIKLFI